MYVPNGYTLEEAVRLRGADPKKYQEESRRAMAEHCAAMVEMQKRGAVVFDYGNNLRQRAYDYGVKDAFSYPGFVPAYIRPLFCQGKGPFRWVLETALGLGMGLKIHADEFQPLGGTALAVELGAVSADHLVRTPPEEIRRLARSDTVAVALPATPFGLGHHEYTPARAILGAGGILALATDCNPGTAWCESMSLVTGLACRYLRLTPAQALVAATLNGAYAVGLGEEVGSLQPGRAADVLILNLPDVHHLGYRFGTNPVERVIKGGQIVIE